MSIQNIAANITFVSAEDVVINEVKNNLRSHFISNSVDEAGLYVVMQRALLKEGMRLTPMYSACINIVNGVAALPPNFLALSFAAFAEVKTDNFEIIERHKETDNLFIAQDLPVEEMLPCRSCRQRECHCDPCNKVFYTPRKYVTYFKDEIGNFKIIAKDEDNYLEAKFIEPLSFDTKKTMSNNKQKMNDLFQELSNRKANEADLSNARIVNNEIRCNKKSGIIYIEYRSNLNEDGVLLIPNYPLIIEWMIKLCEKHLLRDLLYNKMETNVGQILQVAISELVIAEKNAISFIRRITMKEASETQEWINMYYKFLSMKKYSR